MNCESWIRSSTPNFGFVLHESGSEKFSCWKAESERVDGEIRTIFYFSFIGISLDAYVAFRDSYPKKELNAIV